MIEGNWYEHAWVSPVETSSAEVNWAYDLTWPWKPKSGDNTEVSCYVGAQFDADFVSDFLEYVKSIEGYASSSVLKYAHYLKSFDNSLI